MKHFAVLLFGVLFLLGPDIVLAQGETLPTEGSTHPSRRGCALGEARL